MHAVRVVEAVKCGSKTGDTEKYFHASFVTQGGAHYTREGKHGGPLDYNRAFESFRITELDGYFFAVFETLPPCHVPFTAWFPSDLVDFRGRSDNRRQRHGDRVPRPSESNAGRAPCCRYSRSFAREKKRERSARCAIVKRWHHVCLPATLRGGALIATKRFTHVCYIKPASVAPKRKLLRTHKKTSVIALSVC